MNERTNTLLYRNIPLTLYSQKGDVSCVWEVSWRWGQTTTYWPQVLLTIAVHHLHFGWAAQPWITEGPKPSVWSWFSLRWHPISNWLQLQLTQAICGTWLYNCLTLTCFRCSSTYLHRCISWLMARLRVSI